MNKEEKIISHHLLKNNSWGEYNDKVKFQKKKEFVINNLWSYRCSILIKEFVSFRIENEYCIHIVLKHYGTRKIDKIRLVLFADHGSQPSAATASIPDIDVVKEKDVHWYNSVLRNGVFYYLDIVVRNAQEEMVYSWVNVRLAEQEALTFSTLYYHEQAFIQKDSMASGGLFESISNDKLLEIETPRNNRKSNTRSDQKSTSKPEQTVYYNIKQFFSDAVNRIQLKSSNNTDIEADIYIPSIKVAIEYDGKLWHSKKISDDNKKNKMLNDMGIYVIRIRENGLQVLDDFYGKVYIYEHNHRGKHLTDVITDIIHDLSVFVSDNQKRKMLDFTLNYDEYLKQLPSIEARLFTDYKENSFLNHPSILFWDYEKNKELNPNNVEIDSNAYAWFVCPKGNSLIRIINRLPNIDIICAKSNTSKKYCILSICPFIPHDWATNGVTCGKNCPYVEKALHELIEDYIRNGISSIELDRYTRSEISSYPRVAFMIMKNIVKAPEQERAKLENVFFSEKSIYTGTQNFISHDVKLTSIEDIEIFRSFQKLYPNVIVSCNWDIFNEDIRKRKYHCTESAEETSAAGHKLKEAKDK